MTGLLAGVEQSTPSVSEIASRFEHGRELVKSRGITVCINISKGRKKGANDEPKTKGSMWGGGVGG